MSVLVPEVLLMRSRASPGLLEPQLSHLYCGDRESPRGCDGWSASGAPGTLSCSSFSPTEAGARGLIAEPHPPITTMSQLNFTPA